MRKEKIPGEGSVVEEMETVERHEGSRKIVGKWEGE